MSKARFDSEQSAVNIKAFGNGKLSIVICLNGQWKTETEKQIDGTTIKYWECDFNDIVVNSSVIDTEDVIANPLNYIDYTPAAPMTVEERISQIEDVVAEIIVGGE